MGQWGRHCPLKTEGPELMRPSAWANGSKMTQETVAVHCYSHAWRRSPGTMGKQAKGRPGTQSSTQAQVWGWHNNWGVWENNLTYYVRTRVWGNLDFSLKRKYSMRVNGQPSCLGEKTGFRGAHFSPDGKDQPLLATCSRYDWKTVNIQCEASCCTGSGYQLWGRRTHLYSSTE